MPRSNTTEVSGAIYTKYYEQVLLTHIINRNIINPLQPGVAFLKVF